MSTTKAAPSSSSSDDDDDDDKIPLFQVLSPSYHNYQYPQSMSRVQARHLRPSVPPPLISCSNLGKGDMVWVKVFPYAYRPGVIRSSGKKMRFLVSFFGDEEDEEPQWFQDVKIVGFEENYKRMIKICGLKVREEIKYALEEFGLRTVLGLTCSDSSGKIKTEEIYSIRKGFVSSNLVRFVRRNGVFVCGINEDEVGFLEKIRLAAQVVSFRRFLTYGSIVGNFDSRQLLGLVRELGFGSRRFQFHAARMENMIEHVMAFRRFLSVTPDRVFRELLETGSLFEDDSESSISESGSEMSICEGNKQQSPDIAGISSFSDVSFDEEEVLESSKGFSLGLEKEDLMIDGSEMNNGYETLRSSDDELLPPVGSLTNEDLLSDISNSLLLRYVLKDLHIIAVDLCYLGVEKCESVCGYIMTYRKLTGVESSQSTSNSNCLHKRRRQNRPIDKKPEQFSCVSHTFQNDEVDMMNYSDYLTGYVGPTSHYKFDNNTVISIKDGNSTVTADRCPEVLDDFLAFHVDQSDEDKYHKDAVSCSESKTNQDNVVAVNKLDDLFSTPNVSYVEPLPAIVTSLSECKTSCSREMLMQLHSIAVSLCFRGKRRCKTMCTKWLKVRKLIYQNNVSLLSRNSRVFDNNLKKSTSPSYGISTVENEQISKVDGNMNDDQVLDYMISGNVLGGCDPYTFEHSNAPTSVVSAGSTLSTKIDCLGVGSGVCSLNRVYTLSEAPGNQVPESEMINRMNPVAFIICPSVRELLSQLCLLALDIYHSRTKRMKFVKPSILRYRKLVFQNMQDIFSPIDNNRCSQSLEGFQLCASDKLMDDSCVTGNCSSEGPGSVNKPTKDAFLALISTTENDFGDKVQSRNTFTGDLQSSPSVHRNIDESGLNILSGNASNDSLEKRVTKHESASVSTPELLSSSFSDSKDSLITVHIDDPSFQTHINKCFLEVKKFEVPRCDKLLRDGKTTETCKGNTSSDVDMSNKDTQFVSNALNVTDLGNKVKAGHPTSDVIDSQSSLILRINDDTNEISYESHNEKLDSLLGNASGSCDENIIIERPASTGNLVQLNFENVSTEEDIDFDSNRKSSADTDVKITSKNTCSYFKVCTPKFIDGKFSNISSSCESSSNIDQKRKACHGHNLVDQIIYQSKMSKFQDIACAKFFYASPLVANISKPPSSNVQGLVDSYKCAGLSKTLNMKFPRGAKLPSKEQLEKKFSMFGLLDHSRTKIFFYTGVAQIVFLHPIDAKTAFRYVSRKKSFIHCDVQFRLVNDEKFSQENGGQFLPLVERQQKLKIKSCIRRPNINIDEHPKEKRRVRFSVDNYQSSQTINRNATCCAPVSEFPGQTIEMEDISGRLLQLLVKCDSLIEEAKEKIGSKPYYSFLYIQLMSSFRS